MIWQLGSSSIEHWLLIKDGNGAARQLFDRHYSRYHYADGRKPKLFCGPGQKLVLMTAGGDALFAWRKFISGDGQQGLNCAIFRNESAVLSSTLILEAESIARCRWPEELRYYTYVNPRAVASRNPGYCFIRAGWRRCGVTKHRRLLIFEKVLI